MPTANTRASYDRALAAEPALRALNDVVDAMCALARAGQPGPADWAWSRIIKPLVEPLLGWERGYPREQAVDAGEPPLRFLTPAETTELRLTLGIPAAAVPRGEVTVRRLAPGVRARDYSEIEFVPS